jgi:hypothetical protein
VASGSPLAPPIHFGNDSRHILIGTREASHAELGCATAVSTRFSVIPGERKATIATRTLTRGRCLQQVHA